MPSELRDKASTGIIGLDQILGGGLPSDRVYLVEGAPGTGKTTLGMQFLISGAKAGETVLYITNSEPEEELRATADSHGWSLEGVRIHRLKNPDELHSGEQTIFHPAEIELPQVMNSLFAIVEKASPARMVIDSLTEIRTLAREERWYRKQLMALRDFFADKRCTVLLLAESEEGSQPARTIASGLMRLEQRAPDYGPDRRRLRISKLRGQLYASGYHDFQIKTGGIFVYPRLDAQQEQEPSESGQAGSDLPEMDPLLPLDRGTSTAFIGPAGTGKSLMASQYVVASAVRGERSTMLIFDERRQTLFRRSEGVGLDLHGHVENGGISIHQITPGELTPGRFADLVRQEVIDRQAQLVVIDSINGYVHAMPDEHLLMIHLHELLTWLSQRSVTTILVATQTGMAGGSIDSPLDLSYVADNVLVFRHFEYRGEIRKALSVGKRRTGAHESTIRELRITDSGLQIGEPLTDFEGMLRGEPRYVGEVVRGPGKRTTNRRRS